MRSKNLPELVLSASAKWGLAVAFRHIYGGKVRQITYDELPRLSYLFASAFAARGLKTGDRLILCSENSPEWVLACLGALRLGLTVVPVDARSRQSDMESIAEKVRPALFLLGRTQYQMLGPSLDDTKVAVLDEILDTVPDEQGDRPYVSFDALDGQTPALIVFTSGTSGPSKGVVLTHENILSNVVGLAERFDLDCKDRLLSVLPLSHMFEFSAGLIGPLVKGATIVYSRIKGPDHLRELLRIEKISVIIGVPAIYQNVFKSVQSQIGQLPGSLSVPLALAQKMVAAGAAYGGSSGKSLGHLIMRPVLKQLGGDIKFWAAGGAPVGKELVEGFAGLGIPLLAGYGLTEASPVVAANTRTDNRPGSAGRPLRNVRVRIEPLAEPSVDNDDEPHGATAGGAGGGPQLGEILVSGPTVMKGYFEDAEATQSVLRDGWLHTGDVGYIDADGFLYVTGRIKSTIVTAGGYNIHPEEVERALEMSPAIREACVFGLGSVGGEQAYAIIVPAKEFSERDFDKKFFQEEIARCLADVSEYKRLAGFEIYAGSLPRTRSGKIKRAEGAIFYQSLQEQKKNASAAASNHQWDADGTAVCEAICAVLDQNNNHRRCASDLRPSDILTGDLGIDSFARLELAVHLEELFACNLPDEAINDVQTVEELVSLVSAQKQLAAEMKRTEPRAGTASHERFDLITARYQALDASQFKLGTRMVNAVEPWPYAARPNALQAKSDPLYIDAARSTIVQALKVLLRLYNQLEVNGAEHLLAQKPPYIIAANHSSHVDTAAIFASFPPALLPRLHPIAAADTFFVNPLAAFLSARLLNALPFDRFGDYQRSLDECDQLLRNGGILILFPEGTRSVDGSPGAFRTGAARLAVAVGCPIIPAYIEGSHAIMPKKAKLPRPGKLRIRYGEAISPVPHASLHDVQELTQRLHASVMALAEECLDGKQSGEPG